MNRVVHNLRRVVQTLTTYQNGPQLLRTLSPGGAEGELVFRVRDGAVIHCPNQAGARVPVYEVFAEDAYRLDWLLDGLGDSPRVLDIGGHIGCFTVALARRAPGARVQAYEASPSTAGWLVRNVTANGLSERVEVHATAVSDHSGTVSFEDNAGGSSLNRLTETTTVQSSTALASTAVTVPCVTLAEAFASTGAGPDLVKIDTEGAEYAMVLGSEPELWRGVRKVVLEYHDVAGHGWDELAAFFERAGLTLVDRVRENDRQGTAWLVRSRPTEPAA